MKGEFAWPARISVRFDPKELRRLGPFVPGAFQAGEVSEAGRIIDGYLLVDTGAQVIHIDDEVATQIQLTPTEKKEVHGIEGKSHYWQYPTTTLHLPATDANGVTTVFRIPLEPFGAPKLQAAHEGKGPKTADGHPIRVIGVLGRLFLQFVTMTYDGLSGSLEILVDESILYPRE